MPRSRFRHAPPARWLGPALAVLLLLATPAVALAHLHLRHASPAAGAALTTAPREIRLTFSEAPQLAVSSVVLARADGAPVALLPLRIDGASPTTLVAPVAGPVAAGEYTVSWSTTSADGHPVRGRYAFRVTAGAAANAATPTAVAPSGAGPAPAAPAAAAVPLNGFDASSPVYVAIRAVTFVLALGVVGAALFLLGLAPGLAAGFATEASRAAARLGCAAAAILIAAQVAQLGAQSWAVRGAARAFDPALLASLITGTVWGRAWVWGMVAAIVATVAFALMRRPHSPSRPLALLAALAVAALALSMALGGHAAATSPDTALAIGADAIHVLAAGGWLGSLLVVLVAGIPAALSAPSGERGGRIANLVGRFSRVALACVALLVVSGVVGAWLHLGSVPALWRTDYGRVLLVKLALVAAVMLVGAFNWRVMRPALGGESATARLRRSAGTELALGLLVLIVTAVLVATPPPAEQGQQSAAAPVAGQRAPDP